MSAFGACSPSAAPRLVSVAPDQRNAASMNLVSEGRWPDVARSELSGGHRFADEQVARCAFACQSVAAEAKLLAKDHRFHRAGSPSASSSARARARSIGPWSISVANNAGVKTTPNASPAEQVSIRLRGALRSRAFGDRANADRGGASVAMDHGGAPFLRILDVRYPLIRETLTWSGSCTTSITRLS